MFQLTPDFGGRAFTFLDLHFKAQTNYDYVEKFHGNRPAELRDLALKNICGKT